MAACLLGSLSAALLLPSRAPAPSMVASMLETAVEKKVLIPVFPEACEYTGITLTRYMNEVARANPELLDLETLIASIQTACKTINMLVERAHITGLVGYADGGGSINVQGEEQKTLDVVTNDVLKKALRFTGKMGVIASEEEDTPVEVGDFSGLPEYDTQALMDETGRYTAVFDPLDGSSNVDAGIPTGTIFGIFEDDQTCIVPEEGCEPEDPEPEDCDVSAVSAQARQLTAQTPDEQRMHELKPRTSVGAHAQTPAAGAHAPGASGTV
jgi:fructose-1,6-bisphosphatase I